MDIGLFLSTFAMIFLAELGDKTQLVAMARSASGGRMTVFFAASSALVCSTLVAVLFGSALTRVVPVAYIKLASGALFIVFGVLILKNVAFPAAPEAVAPEGRPTALARFVLERAIAFEEASVDNYAKLAQTAGNAETRQLLLALAADERAHVQRLRAAHKEHGHIPALAEEDEVRSRPPLDGLARPAAGASRQVLEQAAQHEVATAAFYAELARVMHIPGLRPVLADLAREEREHAERLQALV